MVCNPFCCTPIRKGAKRLAIIDIVLYFLTLVVSIALEWSYFQSIPISIQFLFVDPEVTATAQPPAEIGKAPWAHIGYLLKAGNDIHGGLGFLLYILLLLFIMGFLILEIWLCCVLIRATTEKRPEFCSKWISWRLSLLMLTYIVILTDVAQMQITATDLLIQPLNILRLYSILAVHQLRKKLYKMHGKLVYLR